MSKVTDCNKKLEYRVAHHNHFVSEINSTIKSGGNLGSKAEIKKIYETWFNDELMEQFHHRFIPLCDCECGEQSWYIMFLHTHQTHPSNLMPSSLNIFII